VADVAYLDSSALVKLVLPEPESEALAGYLRERRPRAVSTILAAVEVPRAVERAEPVDPVAAGRRLRAVLGETTLVDLTLELADQAAPLPPPELRAADAVHLATALALGEDLSAFVAYDRRLLAAAGAAGLPVQTPGAAA
jgi:uncharacterized protein